MSDYSYLICKKCGNEISQKVEFCSKCRFSDLEERSCSKEYFDKILRDEQERKKSFELYRKKKLELEKQKELEEKIF